ncbi:glycogen debranching enzyme [Opitutaceae bacterium TAV1]|nr:glycogen debranching enzyme [Opitutaceae bacterium TAV1]
MPPSSPGSSPPPGPVRYPGLTPRLRQDGGVATTFDAPWQPLPPPPDDAPPDDASPDCWIWLPPVPGNGDATVVCFRKTIHLPAAPLAATAWISADRHYRLYVNGRLVSRGPADPGEDYPGGKTGGSTGLFYCDPRDAADWFEAGENVIAAEVFSERISEWWGSSGHRGFFFQATLTLPGRPSAELRADPAWRAYPSDHFRMPPAGNDPHPPLHYHASAEPDGWRLASFDDRSWRACRPAGRHWPRLLVSEIPPPVEIVYPPAETIDAGGIVQNLRSAADHRLSLRLRGDGRISLRYGRILSAHVGLRVRGPRGCRLRLDLSESRGSGRRSALVELSGRDTPDVFETPFYSSLAWLHLELSGCGTDDGVEIDSLGVIFRSCPVAYRGAFACDDPEFARLWQASRWAVQICMQDRFLDSPDHQEPISDPGDALIESLVAFRAFGEPWLARQELKKFAALLAGNDSLSFHTSYALLWLQMLIDYHDHTGDDGLVRELAPQVWNLLDRFTGWRGRDGLVSEAPDYLFMDWVTVGGFDCHHPPAVIGQGYLTAFYCRGLADAARVAALTGDAARAEHWRRLREETANAFGRELWSPERGRYRDGRPFRSTVPPSRWLPADRDIETFSPHVSTLAVLYDLAPRERHADIMRMVLAAPDFPATCQPYFMHFVFEALAHAGLFCELAPAQMRHWQINPETGTVREMWNAGDWSHGWCGTPLWQISSKILGVQPLLPGFRRAGIRPLPCGLSWVDGRVPTPWGEIHLAWTFEEGPRGEIRLVLPPGVEAEVFPPPGAILACQGVAPGSPVLLSAGEHRLPVIPLSRTAPA